MQKIDLHLHTIEDPQDLHIRHTGSELVDKAAALGYSVLAITLHGRQLEDARLRDYAAGKGILLLPGVEQNVEGYHVLMLNFPRAAAEAVRSFADLDKARSAFPGAFTVAAHPFYPDSTCLGRRLFDHPRLFDAVEISGFQHRLWNPNQKARAAAADLGLPLVGNSDTHTLEQFGTLWTELESQQTPEAVIAGLKAGRGRICGRHLRASEMGRIAWKVVARGYMPWVDEAKARGIPRLEPI